MNPGGRGPELEGKYLIVDQAPGRLTGTHPPAPDGPVVGQIAGGHGNADSGFDGGNVRTRAEPR